MSLGVLRKTGTGTFREAGCTCPRFPIVVDEEHIRPIVPPLGNVISRTNRNCSIMAC